MRDSPSSWELLLVLELRAAQRGVGVTLMETSSAEFRARLCGVSSGWGGWLCFMMLHE